MTIKMELYYVGELENGGNADCEGDQKAKFVAGLLEIGIKPLMLNMLLKIVS